MIGSNTLIVKSAQDLVAHKFGGLFFPSYFKAACNEKNISTFDEMNRLIKRWGEPDMVLVDDHQADEIGDAQTNDTSYVEKYGYRCHQLAGDGVYLLDLVNKTFKMRNRDKKEWVEV